MVMIFFNAKRNLYVMHVVCVCAMWCVCVVNGSSIAASLPLRLPYSRLFHRCLCPVQVQVQVPVTLCRVVGTLWWVQGCTLWAGFMKKNNQNSTK